MPESPVEYATRDALAFITLSRPERLNAINRQLTAALEASVQRANADEAVHVVVLRGAGRNGQAAKNSTRSGASASG